MAQLFMGAVGAAVGFAIGGPAGARWGFAIGTAIGGAMFPPKLPDGPRLNDRQVQSSAYGETIPRVYGSYVVAGNIIWASEIRETANESGGGKGGGPEYTYYTYDVDCAVSLCQGPIIGVRRIWMDGQLAYDSRRFEDFSEWASTPEGFKWFVGSIAGSNLSFELRTYKGTTTQTADALITAAEGVAPAYRGEAYVVFEKLQLEKFGNRIPQMRFEVIVDGAEEYPTPDLLFTYTDSPSGSRPLVGGNVLRPDPKTTRLFIAGQATNSQKPCIYDLETEEITPIERPSGYNYPFQDVIEILPDLRKFVLMAHDNRLGQYFTYIHFYDMDTGQYETTTTIPTSALTTADGYNLWLNPPDGNLLVQTAGAFAPGIYVINTISRTLQQTVAYPTGTNIGISYGVFSYGNIMLVPSPYFGSKLAVYANGTYNLLFVYDFEAEAVEPIAWSLTAFFASEDARPFAYDTRRNRVVCFFSSLSSTNRRNYIAINAEDGVIEEKGYVVGSDITGIVGCHYCAYSDEFALYTSDQIEVVSAKTLEVTDRVDYSLAVSGPRAWFEHPLYPATYYGSRYRGTSGVFGPAIFRWFMGDTIAEGSVSVADIVTEECGLVGLTPSDIDVTNLRGRCRGFLVSGTGSGRGAIEALMNAYSFDAVESGGKLKFVSRSAATTTSIPETDLAAHDPNGTVPTPLPLVRADEEALPESVTIRYADPSQEYQQSVQHSYRYTTNAKTNALMEVPVVLSPGEAKQLADTALYSAWAGRVATKFTTTRKYSAVEPTDLVTIGGNTIRITKKTLEGNMLKFEGTFDSAQVYSSTPVSGTNPTNQYLQQTAATNMQFLDIPILRDADDNGSFYEAAAGYSGRWGGTVIFKSTDGGTTFTEFDVLINASVIGKATTILGEFTDNTFDETNTVDIRLTNDSQELSSKTEEQVLNGSNTCLLGSEILQFKTATLNANGTYTLSGLLRGRRGTITTGHALSDRFVLFDINALGRPADLPAEIGLSRYYKAPTNGTLVRDAEQIEFTNTAEGLRPFSPVHLGGGRNGSTGDVVINWIRRTRVGGEWRDYVDASLGESTESYDVQIYNNASPPAVIRTITATTNTCTYTAAQQTTDFGSPLPTTIKARVAQRSSTYGLGRFTDITTVLAPPTVIYTGTITYALGTGGTGGTDAVNGSAGTASTLSYSGTNLTANGGSGGIYNTNAAGAGGTATGGLFNATGGNGSGSSTDDGGGGGGGINGGAPNTSDANGGDIGGSAVDFQGLNAALTGSGYTLGTGGARGGTASTPANAINGGSVASTAIGAGGGGAGYYGGMGGNGGPGGGGGGAAGNSATNRIGGTGGNGILVILINDTTTTVLTSGTSYSIPGGTSSIKVWLIGAGGGGAGATNVDTGAGGAGGAGGIAYYAWT